jgi:hypothetical protein
MTVLLPIRLKRAILDLAVYHPWNGLTNFLDQVRQQPNAVIILALTKHLMQNLPLPPLPGAIFPSLLPAYREFKTQK